MFTLLCVDFVKIKLVEWYCCEPHKICLYAQWRDAEKEKMVKRDKFAFFGAHENRPAINVQKYFWVVSTK